MGIFGWSLPPGCRTLPGEEPDQPCEICGQEIDDCICPECPVCQSCGDPDCYEKHGLARTQAQIESLAKREREWDEAAKAEADAMYQSFQADLWEE